MWEAFLCRIFNDNRRLIKFIQRALGYSLTGNTDEDALFVPYGTGANGKSTLLGVVKKVMGKDYTTEAAMDLLISVRKNGQTNDIADLRGKRLVTSVETGQRKWLNETLVKKITGGDEVTARRLFENNATFDPTFKVWLATNYKPRIGGTDRGIKRRVRLIPFDVEIPENEWVKDYDDQLIRKEARGILRWLVDGCKAWQADGLGFPPEVTEATERYFDEQDVLGTFLEEVCDRSDPDMETGSTHLLQAYKRFSNDNGMNAVLFSEQLQERGLKKKRTKSGIVWLGIRVSDESYW
jgi:putative DNA primase/helicase